MPTIEKLIRVSSFQSEEQKLIVSIYYINSLIVNHFESVLAPYKISFQQFNVLRILRGQYPKPASVQLIRERMLDQKSDASRVIARLLKTGYLTSQVSKSDKRKADVLITPKGLEVLKQLDEKEKDLIGSVKGLTREEYILANELLQKILNQLTD